MLTQYAHIALFSLVALFFAITMITTPIFLKRLGIVRNKPNPVKNSTFECGMETLGNSQVRFNFRYYFYALMFVALDVLVLFLYPWAVGLRDHGFFGLGIILVFLGLITVGYLYAWKKKVLEWK